MKRKILPVILSLALALGSIGIVFAETDIVAPPDKSFADMPDNWSTAALNKAVDNLLLTGYEEGGKLLIKADNPLTRAEMAAVVNRAFASVKTADISKVTDIASGAWYAADMAKAVKMGTFASDIKMRPGDRITRQEAFAVLSRAFKLGSASSEHKALDKFSDKADIAAWALKDLEGMAAAGYIQGSGGKLNPKADITRAEFAVVMDNLVKQYIDKEGTYSEVVTIGNVMVRFSGVTLKGLTVKGDLIIADGVGEGDVTLDSVKVEGRAVVRGGGENSIVIKGNSAIGKIIVAKVDGKVRISVEGNADVEIVYVADGSDDVIVQGEIGTLEVAGDAVTVTAINATLEKAAVSGNYSKIILAQGTKLKDGTISGKSSAIIVNEGATVDKIKIVGANAIVEGTGAVKNVEVAGGGNNASITTPDTIITVESNVSGVKAGGGLDVPAGSSAKNNSTGDGAAIIEESPSMGGGGGGPSGDDTPTDKSPTLELAGLSYNGEDIRKENNVYMVPIDAINEENENTIGVTIVGKDFDSSKDYDITVVVKKGSSEKTAEVVKIPGSLMKRSYQQSFNKLSDLFDRFILIAIALDNQEAIDKFDELKEYLDSQKVNDEFAVTFSYKTGNKSGQLGEYKFKLID